MPYWVLFSHEALMQLDALFGDIAQAATPDVASRYTIVIFTCCEGFHTFPLRGLRRDDIRPGLRITNYKKRAVIAFAVDAEMVAIIGVCFGGQDYESALRWDEVAVE